MSSMNRALTTRKSLILTTNPYIPFERDTIEEKKRDSANLFLYWELLTKLHGISVYLGDAVKLVKWFTDIMTYIGTMFEQKASNFP